MKLAVIRIKGRAGVKPDTRKTLELLGLRRVNNCAVVDDTPQYKGMLRKANDYITWGEIDDEIIALLQERKESSAKYFRLHPPRKGLERRGIKATFKHSGALGYRGKEINSLIRRML